MKTGKHIRAHRREAVDLKSAQLGKVDLAELLSSPIRGRGVRFQLLKGVSKAVTMILMSFAVRLFVMLKLVTLKLADSQISLLTRI